MGDPPVITDEMREAVDAEIRRCLRTLGPWIVAELGVGNLEVASFDLFKQAIRVRWNARYRVALGKASYKPRPELATKGPEMAEIRLSSHLWPMASEAQRLETVAHELAHLVVSHWWYVAAFPAAQPTAHGPQWKGIMAWFGYPNASPYHRVNFDAIRDRRMAKRIPAECECPGKVHALSRIKVRRIRRGTHSYRCRTCGELVRLSLDPRDVELVGGQYVKREGSLGDLSCRRDTKS